MPTTFYPRTLSSDATVGPASRRVAAQRVGDGVSSAVTTTTAGGTNITVTTGGQATAWYSGQIRQAVTISGTITVNIYGFESANTVNAAGGILIERCSSDGTVLGTIVPDTVIGAEFGLSIALRTANVTPTSTAMAVGERIRITLKVTNAGTMAAGTVTMRYDGTNSATNVLFAEDIITDEPLEVRMYEIIGGNGYNG